MRLVLIVDTDFFTKKNLEKAEYATNPLEDGSLENFGTQCKRTGSNIASNVSAVRIPNGNGCNSEF